MAKTVEEAKARGSAYFAAWDDGYWIGYEDGESSAMADLALAIDGFGLPFDTDGMCSMDVIREMARRLLTNEKPPSSSARRSVASDPLTRRADESTRSA